MLANKKLKTEDLVIDPDLGWTFTSEDDLYSFFEADIEKVETSFKNLLDQSVEKKLDALEFTLDEPDEIWCSDDFFKEGRDLYIFIKSYSGIKQLAFCHCFDKVPVFVFSYFSIPESVDLTVLEGQTSLIKDQYNKDAFKGALEGDSLMDGDEMAVGLYKAMLTLRSQEDFMEEDFVDFYELREPTISEADEIWRSMDSYGNHLVYFIKTFELEDAERFFYYIAATLEDEVSETNVLLFSFPTLDENLVDRYRVGENMQAEEVVHEGSH